MTSFARVRLSDPDYDKPFVDVDEWREEPVRHRYVHGGFEGTDLLFSYYFPPAERERAERAVEELATLVEEPVA